MSNLFSSTPITHRGIPRESSPLVSTRDPTGPAANWRHIAHAQQQAASLTSLMGVVNGEFSKMRQDTDTDYGFHPYKVYPWNSVVNGDGGEDQWRRMVVRTGCVIEGSYGLVSEGEYIGDDGEPVTYPSGLAGSITVGVDKISFPRDNVLSLTFDTTDPVVGNQNTPFTDNDADVFNSFVVAEDAITWVWVELTGYETSTSSLLYGNITRTNLKASATPATQGWNNYPRYNPYIYPIATIDTSRLKDSAFAVINQIRTDNIILNPKSSGYFGKINTVGTIAYNTWGGRGQPLNALVCNNQATNKGLYRSAIWFNTHVAAADFANVDYWTKIADLT